MKLCSKCKQFNSLNLFNKNKSSPDGLRSVCKNCSQSYGKQYFSINKDAIKEQRVAYANEIGIKEKRKSKNKEWYIKNSLSVKTRTSCYAKNNREQYNKYSRSFYQKNKNNFQFIMGNRLRTRIWLALRGKSKNLSMSNLIGCTWDELKIHLETKFQKNMTWENYGYYGWHVDHIKPLSSFDLTDKTQLKQACHHTNLQPLWAKDNLVKSNKVTKEYNNV